MQIVVYSTASKLARDALRNKVDIEVGSEHEGWQNSQRQFWLAQKDYCDTRSRNRSGHRPNIDAPCLRHIDTTAATARSAVLFMNI
jgi:hypothetical protein